MKRLLLLAAFTVVAWAATSPSQAGSFGLCYARDCNSCGAFCIRPYNAFSNVACGVATGGGGGGCGQCDLSSWLFGCNGSGPPGDDSSGAFGNCGPKIAYYGVPSNGKGYNPGCHMNWGGGPVPVPGHMPPPGPYVTPPNYNCHHYFLPPQPFPGMYGIQAPMMAGYYPMQYGRPYGAPGMAPAPAKNAAPAPAANNNQGNVKPASYQQGYPAYNASQLMGWYPAYYMPQGYYGYYGWQGYQGYGN